MKKIRCKQQGTIVRHVHPEINLHFKGLDDVKEVSDEQAVVLLKNDMFEVVKEKKIKEVIA